MIYRKRGFYPRFLFINLIIVILSECEESHNLEFPSAQDYDVASCSKLCTTENNSPRNDITLPLLEIKDFGPPARGGHFCENELKRNELFTSQYSHILHLSVI